METIRAARMVEVGLMVCESIEMPRIEDGEVLVRTEMSSICGSDLHVVMMGTGVGHPLPCPHGYPGHEGIGTVVESRALELPEGTRVLTCPNPYNGQCFQAYQRIKAAYCVPLPETDVPAGELMMAQQFGTVMYAMQAFPRSLIGKTAVVMGQGSAGLFWSYLCKRAGAEQVIVSDLSSARLAASQKFGADTCVNVRNGDLETVVKDLTQGRGAGFVVEAVGRPETFLESVHVAATDGEIMWFGLPGTDGSMPMDFNQFFRKRLRANSQYGAQFEAGASSFREALRLIANREIDVSPLLS
ncbi:MAG: zinc-binding dehydrogenase, partial [Pseudomonadota bacterium]